MNNKIWRKLRRLFNKRPPSTETIISEEKMILGEAIDADLIYSKIHETIDNNEKEALIKKIARQEVAKEILEFVENENTTAPEKKKDRKKLYELHELRTELQKLEEQKVTLHISQSKIKSVNYG